VHCKSLNTESLHFNAWKKLAKSGMLQRTIQIDEGER